MEKRTAHYSLALIKELVLLGKVSATRSALTDAAALGYTFDDMKFVIGNLETSDLYKSMTTHHNNKLWQDVYRYPASDGDLYLKLQVIEDVVIISFKEL